MIAVLSPAKSLDFESDIQVEASRAVFLKESKRLGSDLKKLSSADLQSLMSISEKLADLNVERFQQFKVPFPANQSRPAVYAFTGDVYLGLNIKQFNKTQVKFAQKHIRILSGLYGILKPLDDILPYRLEMGTKFASKNASDLYDFWGSKISDSVNEELATHKSKLLVNLASQEYFKVLDPKRIDAELIEPVFKDYKNGQYKIISFFAKKARGMMAAHIIKNKVNSIDGLAAFSEDGYSFDKAGSSGNKLLFTRKQDT
ncbi:MAG: peroxide stress protein YaaA [Lentisphaeria bacterium]|nr:peroxide stress protein YaaA [Lentisphaeria bacterium]NQZ66675.1 peroxide stress protein YaaA [Lentisphaeria bacterium]